MLARIQAQYKDIDLLVVAVNILLGASFDSWKRYWEEKGGGEAVLAADMTGEAVRALNIRTSGATVVIDREGRIVHRDRGATSYEVLEVAVEGIF